MLHAGLVRRRYRVAVLARLNLVVRRIDVAIAAHGPVVRNAELSMVENRAKPRRGRVGGMAGVATVRIVPGSRVIWHVGAIILRVSKVRSMALAASHGREFVVATHVAVRAHIDHRTDRAGDGRAWRQHMGAEQGEASRTVIKLPVRPENRVMARCTLSDGEASDDVVRDVSTKIRRGVPIFQVATTVAAIWGREARRIVVPRVAIGAEIYFSGGC